MMEPVLKMEHVTKRFSGLVAVNDLSLEMPENCIHSLIGPNGSGKSTSINMINGSFPVTSGKIYFNDKDITGWKMHKIAAAGMGRTYQNLKLFRSMLGFLNPPTISLLFAPRDHFHTLKPTAVLRLHQQNLYIPTGMNPG